ncbi:MAG: hypothetical protein KDK45_18930, partial [Leptospiraceae bacterium]|nr:hypothetical protein [Leptospiraceae bacterium]
FYLGKANILKKLLSSSAANMQENIGISFIPEKYYPFFLNLIFFTFFILLFLRFRILLLISIFSLAGIFLAAYWDMQSKTFFPEALSFAYVALLVLTFFIGKR